MSTDYQQGQDRRIRRNSPSYLIVVAYNRAQEQRPVRRTNHSRRRGVAARSAIGSESRSELAKDSEEMQRRGLRRFEEIHYSLNQGNNRLGCRWRGLSVSHWQSPSHSGLCPVRALESGNRAGGLSGTSAGCTPSTRASLIHSQSSSSRKKPGAALKGNFSI